MALKKLLVAFTTTREVEGEDRRVRFASGKVVDLTADELETLTKLTASTGKLHFRDPVNEGGKVSADEPEVVVVPDFAGQDVAMDKKNVDHLKAYLTFNEIVFADDAKKADLLALATAPAGDPDAGL